MKEASPSSKGARRCTNPESEFGGRWIVGGMRVLRNGKFSKAREVIDPGRGDFRILGRYHRPLEWPACSARSAM
jgi:hypothetical protein